jgi:hypothetical protein
VKPTKYRSGIVIFVEFVLIAWLSAGFTGCKPLEWPVFGGGGGGGKNGGLKVKPVSNRDVAALTSDDIVHIMRRAGFSDDQILELGTEVRNALMTSGAAEIKKDKVEVIFAVRGEYVFVTTRLRGNFIYDIKKGAFGIMRPSSSAEHSNGGS